MDWFPVLGVLIVVFGLALGSKFNINPLISVLLGGFVSGLLGGHAAFIRPLIYPMARGALGDVKVSEDDEEQIKAMTVGYCGHY